MRFVKIQTILYLYFLMYMANFFDLVFSFLLAKSNSSQAGVSTAVNPKSDAKSIERFMRIEMFGGIWTWCLLLVLLLVFGS